VTIFPFSVILYIAFILFSIVFIFFLFTSYKKISKESNNLKLVLELSRYKNFQQGIETLKGLLKMNTFQIVRTEHLNHHSKLFGGYMLLWVDELAWLTASRDFTRCRLVTRSMDKIDFTRPVEVGSILRFNILPEKIGRSSVVYQVKVYADAPQSEQEELVFTNKITFVNLNKQGKTEPLPEQTRPLKSECCIDEDE